MRSELKNRFDQMKFQFGCQSLMFVKLVCWAVFFVAKLHLYWHGRAPSSIQQSHFDEKVIF